jgi:cardiolipin synthase
MTVPNVVSLTRLIGVFALVYFGLISPNYLVVLLLFGYAGFSDWLDGFLARKLDQFSKLGEKLDPLADRLYIFVALLITLNENLISHWVVGAVLGREILLALVFVFLRFRGFSIPPVHYIGKAGTLMLMYAFPLIVAGGIDWYAREFVTISGQAFLAWAVVTYWVAGYLYLRQSIQALKGS